MAEPSDESLSIISTTKYGKNSAKLLRAIEKNLILIIVVVGVLTVVSILDAFGALRFFHMETVFDYIIAVFAVAAVVIMIPLLVSVQRSRRLLQRWERLFEENSLRSSFELCLAGPSSEHALRALAECVEEIGEQLQEYVSKAGTSALVNNKRAEEYGFDVLIDPDSIAKSNLQQVISDYGSVIVKSMPEQASTQSVESFLTSLSEYVAKTGHPVGLAIFIAEDFDKSAHALAKHASGKNKISTVLLVEKPAAKPTLT